MVVPDLELKGREYLKEIEDKRKKREINDKLPSEKFLDRLCMGERTKTSFVLKMLYSGHKGMYDQFSLTALLTSCGFVDIQKRSYKEGECPDIDLLDSRPEESLYLEARKL